MRTFVHTGLPGRVVFGAGSARQALAPEVERLGGERVLVVATAAEGPLARTLAEPLGSRLAGAFLQARMHVPAPVAEQAVAAAHEIGADLLLSVGGGSTTGTAKAIALETGLPILAVPTTYAGSEMTPVWGMTRDGVKTTGRDDRVLPRTVVYDAELTTSLPAAITAASVVNALAHCVEAFYAPGASPMTALMAQEGIRALATGGPAAVGAPEDLDARGELLYGAYLAGAAFAVAGSSLHHKLCHVLGGAFDLPHAETHAVVLPHVVAHLAPELPEAMARIARAVAPDTDTDAATALRDLAGTLGAPTALRDVGMRDEDLDRAAGLAAAAVAPDTPGDTSEPALRRLLQAAHDGRILAAPITNGGAP